MIVKHHEILRQTHQKKAGKKVRYCQNKLFKVCANLVVNMQPPNDDLNRILLRKSERKVRT